MVQDRIADPWGPRTPFAPGDDWPERVDAHYADGVTEDDVERWVQTASLLHSNGDAMDIAVKDDRIVGVRGRVADRVNRGRLDPKDLFGWQANSAPDRLTRPLVRENGQLVETGWDEAMELIRACHGEARRRSKHVITLIRVEDDEGEHDKIRTNVASVEEKAGHALETCADTEPAQMEEK